MNPSDRSYSCDIPDDKLICSLFGLLYMVASPEHVNDNLVDKGVLSFKFIFIWFKSDNNSSVSSVYVSGGGTLFFSIDNSIFLF